MRKEKIKNIIDNIKKLLYNIYRKTKERDIKNSGAELMAIR